ncbi:prevent-host-death protein [Treponema primitia]|uniref:prevent-host-death protein n=1 Tax=Treponema primitia TaxID=88058 RepID=UPI00398147FF
MLVFDYTDFTQDTKKIFDAALTDEVIISNKDGNSYKLLPIKEDNTKGKSPLEDIPYINADITTQEIVELLRESRAGI